MVIGDGKALQGVVGGIGLSALLTRRPKSHNYPKPWLHGMHRIDVIVQ